MDATSENTSDASDEGGVAAKYSGTVIVSTNAVAMHYDVFGLFQPIQQTPTCTPTNNGACTFSDCPSTMSSDAGAPLYFLAGMLDVTAGTTTVPVPKMATGEYRAMGSTTLFNGGDKVTAKWTGDMTGAPGMSISTVGASHIIVTSPSFPVVGVPVSKSQPFNLQWTGGMFGKVHVSLETYPMNRVQTVSCVVDATAGNFDVPASLLAMLSGSTGYLAIDVLGATTTNQGEWAMTIEAHDMATAADPPGRALILVGATFN